MKAIRQFIADTEISLKVLITLGLLTFGLPILFQSCGKDFSYTPVPGPQGVAGTNGRDGVDAYPVTAVQLCPGTPVYPSTYIEYAFCIQGHLYAVYSANGGFEAYLPLGTYSSNAINSSCSFTVGDNCQVTND